MVWVVKVGRDTANASAKQESADNIVNGTLALNAERRTTAKSLRELARGFADLWRHREHAAWPRESLAADAHELREPARKADGGVEVAAGAAPERNRKRDAPTAFGADTGEAESFAVADAGTDPTGRHRHLASLILQSVSPSPAPPRKEWAASLSRKQEWKELESASAEERLAWQQKRVCRCNGQCGNK